MQKLLRENRLTALAAPREFAKSTFIDVVHTIWELYFKRFHYLILFGDTASQAEDMLRSVVTEIETNQLLIEDFGRLKPDIPLKWTDGSIITTTDVRIDAMGVGGKVRGRRHKQWRPDRMKFDDIENDENVATTEQRKKLREWFFKAAMPALDKERGRAVIIGTILHYDSHLANLTDPKQHPRFAKRIYRALNYDEKGQPYSLWPDRWSLEDLAEKKALLGSLIFEQELNNRPVAEQDAIIKRAWIKYHRGYTPEEAADWQKVIRIDPAAKAKEKDDEYAICVVALDRKNQMYQLDAHHGHHEFSDNLALAYNYAEKWSVGRPENVVIHVEDNVYQVALKQEVDRLSRESGRYWTVKGRHTVQDKTLRLKAQSGMVESGYVLFDPNTSADLVDQLCDFGATRFDDLMDAFIGAIEGLRKATPGFVQYLKDRATEARKNPAQSFIAQHRDLIQ